MPQNVRNVFDESGEWARSSFDHTHQFLASGTYRAALGRSDARGVTGRAAETAGAPTRSSSRNRGRRSRSTWRRSGQRRRRPGAAPRSDAATPTCPAASAPRSAGSTRRRSRCRRRSRSGARRATASSARATRRSTPGWPRRGRLGGTRQLEFRWEVFNVFNRANFDLPNRDLRQPQLRPDLQRQGAARNAVRAASRLLTRRGRDAIVSAGATTSGSSGCASCRRCA